jgi:hypothetical protein
MSFLTKDNKIALHASALLLDWLNLNFNVPILESSQNSTRRYSLSVNGY